MHPLPSELVHPEWNGLYLDSDHLGDITNTSVKTVEGWAVYLEFRTEDHSSSGSGFFLNMPSMQEHELILTSAQNLIDEKGNEVEDLRISDVNQSNLEIVGQWYCPAYRRSRKPEYDYAAIKVKRTTAVAEGRGLGFSMCLGDKERLSGRVGVTGYHHRDSPYVHAPTTSMGPILTNFGEEKEFLEYRAATDDGLTGSPVWIGYDGHPIAIGIQ